MKYILILLLCGCCTYVFAAEVDVQFEQANQAYRNGDFQKAIQMYSQIVQQGYKSAELFYNLGNAYYKSNRIPDAILSYERSLKLSPGDEDAAHNLALANLRIEDRIDAVPKLFFVSWWRAFADSYPASKWAWISIASVWGACILALALVVGLRWPLIRQLVAWLVIVALFFSALSLAAMFDRSRMERSRNFAILFSASVQVRSAPDEQSTDLFVIHEGVKLELLDSVGDWNKIRLADGKIGWVRSNTFQII
jgi:tetratricopeptide (TPR) repeat protein